LVHPKEGRREKGRQNEPHPEAILIGIGTHSLRRPVSFLCTLSNSSFIPTLSPSLSPHTHPHDNSISVAGQMRRPKRKPNMGEWGKKEKGGRMAKTKNEPARVWRRPNGWDGDVGQHMNVSEERVGNKNLLGNYLPF
jgi:hypothetical protein